MTRNAPRKAVDNVPATLPSDNTETVVLHESYDTMSDRELMLEVLSQLAALRQGVQSIGELQDYMVRETAAAKQKFDQMTSKLPFGKMLRGAMG